MANPRSEDAGLSASCSCDDKHCALGVLDGLQLSIIKIKIVVHLGYILPYVVQKLNFFAKKQENYLEKLY